MAASGTRFSATLRWLIFSAKSSAMRLRWRNRMTPRFFFTAPRYREGTIERIVAPLMVTVARDDEMVSSEFVKQKAARARHPEIREYPVRHFEIYHGATRDRVAADQLTFFGITCLRPRAEADSVLDAALKWVWVTVATYDGIRARYLSRTTSTGAFAPCATAELTEPRSIPVKPPRP